ncbi:uncharacterized protein LOC123309897 [Coccinella septempunctata]|uniref:uncharacterized protein LOC123309897 n=1 Tax=Coccinella septempunctata TaxID=41139 RepID=UPI001D087CBB|nr:uncharacterized protein LOC123309897 [Coccinella septempunctata]
MGHKMAAFNTYVNRLLRIPLKEEFYEKEVSTLKYIAVENGYSPEIIDNLIKKKKQKQSIEATIVQPTSEPATNSQTDKFCNLPYYGNISHKIARVLGNLENTKIAFKSKNTLQQYLIKNKTPVDSLEKPGVYRLECGDSECNAVYVGRSGRSIKTRTREHLYSLKNPNNNKSIFGSHLRDEEHCFDINTNVKLLHHCDFGFRQEILEEVEIFKHMRDNRYNTLNAMLTNNIKETYKLISPSTRD